MKRLLLILIFLASPLWAVEPHEMLDDPVLEARAQELDTQLRCVKCQSEAIGSSNAAWAADARVLVRELLVDGFSDDEVLDFFVVRYGEFVLMEPRTGGSNMLLWLAGPIMLVFGLGMGWATLRRRNPTGLTSSKDSLSADEKARLDEIMRD